MQDTTDSPGNSPKLTQLERERQIRQERVAQALRANLLRRKTQARARASESAQGESPDDPHASQQS